MNDESSCWSLLISLGMRCQRRSIATKLVVVETRFLTWGWPLREVSQYYWCSFHYFCLIKFWWALRSSDDEGKRWVANVMRVTRDCTRHLANSVTHLSDTFTATKYAAAKVVFAAVLVPLSENWSPRPTHASTISPIVQLFFFFLIFNWLLTATRCCHAVIVIVFTSTHMLDEGAMEAGNRWVHPSLSVPLANANIYIGLNIYPTWTPFLIEFWRCGGTILMGTYGQMFFHVQISRSNISIWFLLRLPIRVNDFNGKWLMYKNERAGPTLSLFSQSPPCVAIHEVYHAAEFWSIPSIFR